MYYALTSYPLSAGFRARLEAALSAEPVYMSISELRRMPRLALLRRLRSLDGARLVLPLEDESSRCILPALQVIAAVSNAQVIEVVCPDLRAERLSRWQLVPGVGAMAGASVRASYDSWRNRQELSRLWRAPLATAALGNTGRVLHLNANLWFGVKAGGSVGHIAGVINALSQRGYAVTYASVGGSALLVPGVSSILLTTPGAFAWPPELNHSRFHGMVVRQLQRVDPPRFLYQRLSLGSFSGVVLSRHWGVPLLLEYNGSQVWVEKQWGKSSRPLSLASKAEDVCLRHAHLVVAVSDVLRDELVARGVRRDRIICHPNGIDPTVFDPGRFADSESDALRRDLEIPSDATVVTFIGTFGEWHGAEVLARAIRLFVDAQREWLLENRVRFLLVGSGLKMPDVRRILEDVDTRFVKLPGLVSQADAPRYLAASDVLVSPHVPNRDGSRFFGSPTKLFEYMAMGKAIVASDLEQIGQVLRNSVRVEQLPCADPADTDSRLAVLVPPGDVVALMHGIRFAVEQPAWRMSLGRNARREALSKYTWTHHVDAIVERLERLCSHPRNGV